MQVFEDECRRAAEAYLALPFRTEEMDALLLDMLMGSQVLKFTNKYMEDADCAGFDPASIFELKVLFFGPKQPRWSRKFQSDFKARLAVYQALDKRGYREVSTRFARQQLETIESVGGTWPNELWQVLDDIESRRRNI